MRDKKFVEQYQELDKNWQKHTLRWKIRKMVPFWTQCKCNCRYESCILQNAVYLVQGIRLRCIEYLQLEEMLAKNGAKCLVFLLYLITITTFSSEVIVVYPLQCFMFGGEKWLVWMCSRCGALEAFSFRILWCETE